MSPEAPIVDCGPFCAVGVLRTIDKSEFSHSLDPKRTLARFLSLHPVDRGYVVN